MFMVHPGLPGKNRCTVSWPISRKFYKGPRPYAYLQVEPHALLHKSQVVIEYIIDGFLQGSIRTEISAALKFQLALVRNEAWAWKALTFMQGRGKGARTVTEIPFVIPEAFKQITTGETL